ncbi:hypothetical protein QYE76_012397 [Lolium multiflorum]|uniref:Reverse transcriptase domain-containing protein n=1 Tax=Lolium multiflorum TaxID=4521 RepID=A0AAD8U109_LOLMU|nr:hypothetical protein QYE76_012397 [Lolium multiflorum]
MENYSLLMGAAAVMKMAVEMAAVSMEKPSGHFPAPAVLDSWVLQDSVRVEEVALRQLLKRRLLGLASLDRTIARQRARVAGVLDCDASAQFFRIQSSKRLHRNHIGCLRNGDRVASDQGAKETLATDFYAELLVRPRPRDHDLNLAALGLPQVDLSSLDANFSEAEVWAAVKEMSANKSPGPDGLSWEFFRAFWPTVKMDILEAIQAVFLGKDQALERLNVAYLTLLPKRDGATELKDFRPISLVHSFAKLVAKILALRLAPKMAELIGDNQSAFIRGRCIQDNVCVLAFLLSIMRQRGFGSRWIRWIVALLRTASTRFLINGCAGPPFIHARGLRQGDPLSPLLFVLVMDVLAAMFLAAERTGAIRDLSAVGLKHRVSLYADDMVVFARPEVCELQAIRDILGCFGSASGLEVNFTKSTAAPIRCSPAALLQVTPLLDCPIKALPTTYLGLPLTVRKLTKTDLQPVIDKLAAKLAFWKARLMSWDGRVGYVQILQRKYSRNWVKSTPGVFFAELQKTGGVTKRDHGARHHGGAAEEGPRRLLTYLPPAKAFVENPCTESHDTENLLGSAAANPISGDSGDRLHTLRRGESSPEGSTSSCPPPD